MDKKIQTNNKLEELDLFSSMIPFERLEGNVNLVFYEYLKKKRTQYITAQFQGNMFRHSCLTSISEDYSGTRKMTLLFFLLTY